MIKLTQVIYNKLWPPKCPMSIINNYEKLPELMFSMWNVIVKKIIFLLIKKFMKLKRNLKDSSYRNKKLKKPLY